MMTTQKRKPSLIVNLTIIILVNTFLALLVRTQSPNISSKIIQTTTPATVASDITSIPIPPSTQQYLITTTLKPENDSSTATNTTSDLLVSREEFVDFTEAPMLLFDGTSIDTNETTSKNASEKSSLLTPTKATTTTTIQTNTQESNGKSNDSVETSTTSIPTTTAEEEIDEEDGSGGVNHDEVGGEIQGEAKEQPFSPPQNVSQYMDYIENLFHDLRHQITDLFEPHLPQLIRTSRMVQLSGSCSYDMLRMALALRQFEPWALRMIDSSGKVPEGILEGSFTALGSYDECLSIVFGSGANSKDNIQMTSSSSHQQPHQEEEQQQQQVHSSSQTELTQGKYCLVNVSPFLPPKPHADRVERLFQDEANRRNYTKDDQFSRLSGMFYYMKFRIGVCIPSTCLNSDLESISSALSSNLRLNITIPNCRVLEQKPVTNSQIFSGLVLGVVLLVVIGSTVMDCSRRRKWSYDEKYDGRKNVLVLDVMTAHDIGSGSNQPATLFVRNNSTKLQQQQQQQQLHSRYVSSNVAPTREEGSNFSRRLDKHWSWLSFSLLTNYKLYFTSFTQRNPTISQQQQQQRNHQQASNHSMMFRCLNGIRVLSLCWVIVANSYITLDPRATKRLVQTREAPKDFFFQMVVQASLAIETFFFLSGVLMSLSFARKLKPDDDVRNGSLEENQTKTKDNNNNSSSYALKWLHFYLHRYVRMTPATMLVIALSMFAYSYGDGPLWFEATHKAHQSCSQNWWRHLLHVANYIDTRQMCFIHYWYIAADMQLFLFAPLLMYLLYKKKPLGYSLATLVGLSSIGSVFYTTYSRSLPPTLLFYNSDPESRREFGNTIMTKPLTHALPYMVGMLVGKWLSSRSSSSVNNLIYKNKQTPNENQGARQVSRGSLSTLFGLIATIVALAEVFLPYKWNNSHLPSRLLASMYAAVFRFGWSLVLAYLVVSCRHKRDKRCRNEERLIAAKLAVKMGDQHDRSSCYCDAKQPASCSNAADNWRVIKSNDERSKSKDGKMFRAGAGSGSSSWFQSKNNNPFSEQSEKTQTPTRTTPEASCRMTLGARDNDEMCMCGSGGNLLNRLLSLNIFSQLSKLSFVAYLIHLPLMSVFVAQTRGLFAFSHTLVIHLALSYLMMTFILAFVLVHIIEFPFITFERYLFEKLFYAAKVGRKTRNTPPTKPTGANLSSSGVEEEEEEKEKATVLPLEQTIGSNFDWGKEKMMVELGSKQLVAANKRVVNVGSIKEKNFNYSERL